MLRAELIRGPGFHSSMRMVLKRRLINVVVGVVYAAVIPEAGRRSLRP